LGREVVQLEDLVKWAEKAHGSSHKDVTAACEVKDQANSVVKVRTWVGVDSCRGTLEAMLAYTAVDRWTVLATCGGRAV